MIVSLVVDHRCRVVVDAVFYYSVRLREDSNRTMMASPRLLLDCGAFDELHNITNVCQIPDHVELRIKTTEEGPLLGKRGFAREGASFICFPFFWLAWSGCDQP